MHALGRIWVSMQACLMQCGTAVAQPVQQEEGNLCSRKGAKPLRCYQLCESTTTAIPGGRGRALPMCLAGCIPHHAHSPQSTLSMPIQLH